MLLDAAHAQLLIVDVQERLLPAMQDGEAIVDCSVILLKAAAALNIPALLSEQYRKGLGATVPRLFEVKGNRLVFEKMSFSCAADAAIAAHVMATASQGRRQIVIAGIEAHICVLQTALGFHAMGLDVFVVADATGSRRPDSVTLAHQRLRHGGVTIVNTEMVLFEWLRLAGTPSFKMLSKLIK